MKPLAIICFALFAVTTLRGQTPAAAPTAKAAGEWTVLFNGKDLTGWTDAA